MDDFNQDAYFVGIKFRNSEKSYYFSTHFVDLKQGDFVIVETPSGFEMATVSTPVMSQSLYRSPLQLKPIVRKPTPADMDDYAFNLEQDKKALAITEREVKKLGLAMDLLDADYNLDGSKITITYTSTEHRVDFRELLRILPPLLHARIEFHQLSPRERARKIGGIGVCGLPFCCSTFLTWSQPIGITLAKNQMLTLNTQKLSGPCGKLICCLAYENETYDIEKKDFPRPGTIVHLEEGDYHVESFNIISRNVRLANASRDNFKTYSLEDVQAMMAGTYKKPVEKPKEDALPDFNIPGLKPIQPERENRQVGKGQNNGGNQNRNPNKNPRNNRQSGNKNPQNRNNGNKFQQGGNDNGKQGKPQNQPHRYHSHRPYRSGPKGNAGNNSK